MAENMWTLRYTTVEDPINYTTVTNTYGTDSYPIKNAPWFRASDNNINLYHIELTIPMVSSYFPNIIGPSSSAGHLYTFINTVQYIDNISDLGYVTNFSNGFQELRKLISFPSINTINAKDMSGMFRYCTNLTNISNFDTSNVTDMDSMFINCEVLTTLDVSKFDTSKVTNMNNMFNNCPVLTTIGPVDTASGWQHKPDNYTNIFTNCPATPKPNWYK